MSYPMTFKRFVNRNGMTGDYGTRISTVNLDQPGLLGQEHFLTTMAPHWRDALLHIDMRWGCILGDLRRLEKDGQDEDAICKHIAERTGVDPETVAVVLKEFLTW